jgi:ABC-2 type transport system ATP-binding protein
VKGLSKSYGEIRALEGVDFTVAQGEVFGYLGPNGAGKTTTVNILCDLIRRDAGEVRICGLDLDRDPVAVKGRIGVVPEESNLYPELTCRRNLEYLAELYGLARAARRRRTEELLEAFDLAERREAPFRALSRGMKRRLTVAAALLHSPEVVFLDEPTAGLDVPSARALRSLIRTINSDGTTVFLTTHNLAEAEGLCGRILILAKGHVVTEGTAAEIRQRVEKARTLSVVLSGDVGEGPLVEACPAVRSAVSAEGRWHMEVTDTHAAVAQIGLFAEKQGLRLVEIESVTTSLEDAFMTILKEREAPS